MRILAVLLASLILAACGRATDPLPPRAPAAAPTFDEERSLNMLAYRERYAAIAGDLMSRKPGAWVAIVGGRILPEVDGRVEPTESLDELIRAADAVAPHALHRLVFRVGDNGNVNWPMGACELEHVVGAPFLALLDRDDVEMRGIAPGEPIKALFGEALREITVAGPDERIYLRPAIGPPGAPGKASAEYCVSTGFAGFVVLPAADYPDAGRWEIPGIANVHGGMESGLCSRAIARLSWPGSALDFVVPVALWPE